MGAICSIAAHTQALGQALRNGDSGIRTLSDRDPSQYHSLQAATVPNAIAPRINADNLLPEWSDRATRLGSMAFDEAIAQSGLPSARELSSRSALSVGTTLGGMCSGLRFYEDWIKRDVWRTRWLRDFSPYAMNDHLMARSGITGMSLVLSSACAASAHALGTAFDLIRTGRCDVVIAGGVDTFTDLTHAGFGVLGLLSQSDVKPFSRERTGLVLGEAAAFLVLESEHHALSRDAEPLGEMLGFGMTSDAFHMTSPEADGRGATEAMRMALACAEATPDDIVYINAHGTATQKNDATEVLAMEAVFGLDRMESLPVSSTKSMVGHTLGAAGALEAVASLVSLNEGFLPPTISTTAEDVEFNLDCVTASRTSSATVAMSNSFGFGGNNASLIFRASAS